MACFVAIQALILAVFLVLNPGPRNDYFEATLDKHRMLGDYPPPRVLLVGGSGVAFGFDGAVLEAATGRRPVNLGLHANLGADFLLDEGAAAAQAGDTVVLSLEYEHYVGDQTDPTLWTMLGARPASASQVSFRQWRRVLDQGLLTLRQVCGRVLSGKERRPLPGYSRAEFNEYGDVVGHHGNARRFQPPADAPPVAFSTGAVQDLADQIAAWTRDLGERGVRALVAYPPLPTAEFERRRSLIEAVEQALDGHPEVERLGQPEDAILPADHFYDTEYHMTGDGQRVTSERLGPLLRAALGE